MSHTGLDLSGLVGAFFGLLVNSADEAFGERELSDWLSSESVCERRETVVSHAAESGTPLPIYYPASVFTPDDQAEKLP